VARAIALRRQARIFANHWHDGVPDRHGVPDLAWLRADGATMFGDDWPRAGTQVLGCLASRPGGAGAPLLLMFNPEPRDADFALPPGAWEIVLHSADEAAHGRRVDGGAAFALAARSVVVLAATGHSLRL